MILVFLVSLDSRDKRVILDFLEEVVFLVTLEMLDHLVFLVTPVLLLLQLWSRESKDPLVLRECLEGKDQLVLLVVKDFQVNLVNLETQA